MIVFAPSLWNATAAAEANLWDIDIAGPLQFPRWRGIFLLVKTRKTQEPAAVLIWLKPEHGVL